MKLYPELFKRFAAESGRLRTPASTQSFKYVCSALQAEHPTFHVKQFRPVHLTAFCMKGDVAPKTIKHRRSVLMVVFDWATFQGLVERNPAAGLKYTVAIGAHEVRHGRWLGEDKVAELIRACPDDFMGRRDRLILMFGFMMGLRRAALADLRWTQISSDLSVLEIKVKGQKRTRKGIPAQIRSELADWALEKPESAVAVFPGLKELGLGCRLVEPDWSKPLGANGIAQAVKRAGERIGIELSPHDMRRSLAGLMETKGYAVTDIQRALDHSNVGTTSVYLDKNPNRTEAVTGGLTLEL